MPIRCCCAHLWFVFLMLFAFACKPSAGNIAEIQNGLGARAVNSDIQSWLAREHTVELDVFAPPNSPEHLPRGGLRWYTPERFQRLLAKSTQCLNEAFQAAGYSNTKFRFHLKKVTHLSEEIFAKLPKEPWDLPLDHAGNFLRKRGCEAESFPVYFSEKVSQPVYVNPDDPEAVRLAREWIALRECTSGNDSACKGFEHLTRCQKEEKIRNYALNTQLKALPAAALLYANPVFNLPTGLWAKALSGGMTEAEITAALSYDFVYIVHEFLHVYGGLDDRYHNPEFYDQTNIMGNTEQWTCKLTPDQVLAIHKFRSSCEKERLERRESSPVEPCVE